MTDRRVDPSAASGDMALLALKSREIEIVEELLSDDFTKFRSEFVPHWQIILKKAIAQKQYHHIAEKILERKYTVVNIIIVQLACKYFLNFKTHFQGTFGAIGVVRLCLEAEPNAYSYRKALRKACEHGHIDIVRMVIEAQPYLKRDHQALYKARKNRHIDVYDFLMSK